MADFQPIDNAPKDGTVIAGWSPRDPAVLRLCRWGRHLGQKNATPCWVTITRGVALSNVPTHYIAIGPLPGTDADGVGVVQPPSQQDIAEALLQWPYRTGSSVCPLCGHDTPHDHTPREITIYRNGVKWGQRNGTEPWPGKDHQGVEKDGQDDAGPTGSACWVGADQHHQHRARQPDPDGADHQRHSGRDGLSGGSEVPSEVTDRAPAAVGINGLTEAETSATASVMGIAGVDVPRGGQQ